MRFKILCIAGPTASGKSSRGVQEAHRRNGEIISVDSRQIYRGLDIGTEKIQAEDMQGIPHHLIDVRDPRERYSAGDFVVDAERLIQDIHGRGKLPILVGGTHFYFDALLRGLPATVDENPILRRELESVSSDELMTRVLARDPRRAKELDSHNRRRIIRALEIINSKGSVPERTARESRYEVEWLILDPADDALRANIATRLQQAFDRGLVDEVRRVRELVGDARLHELGLEYRIVGEYLRGECAEDILIPTLTSKLWQLARSQRKWLRKLKKEVIPATGRNQDKMMGPH
jgi:tRNA dimethylallyltransferase